MRRRFRGPGRFQLFLATLVVVAVAVPGGVSVVSAAEPAPARLAILAVDTGQETEAVADLLTAELAAQPAVQIVEREEIRRVLAEQNLSVTGLAAGADRVRAGRLLNADGLVFVQHEREPRQLAVRLVESRAGYQAAQFVYRREDAPLATIVQWIAKDLLAAVPKLSLDASRRRLVSIVRIGNATLSPDYFWIEDAFPQLFAQYFARDPRTLVLERRQLGQLLQEAELTGGTADDFRRAGILIDGEVRLREGEPLDSKSPQVSFVVRLRDPALRERGRVSVDGRLTALDDLAARTAAAVFAELAKIGPASGTPAGAEAAAFLEIAKRQGTLWAAEAAHALSVTNRDATLALVRSLAEQALPQISHSPERPELIRRAQQLAQAAELCRTAGARELRRALTLRGGAPTRGFLTQHFSKTDPEVRAVLTPVRRLIRLEAEAYYAESNDLNWFLLESPPFFDNPLDYQAYIQALLDRLVRSGRQAGPGGLSPATRVICQTTFVRSFYEALLQEPEPELRLFALYKLGQSATAQEARRGYARQALDLATALLANKEFLAGLGSRSRSGDLFHGALAEILAVCPERKEAIARQVAATFTGWLEQGDLRTFAAVVPEAYFAMLPPEQVVEMIDAVLKLVDARATYSTQPLREDIWLANLRRTRGEYASRCQPARAEDRSFTARVLLEPKALPGLAVDLLPERLVLDGPDLWVGMGRARLGIEHPRGVGLIHLDLNTGQVRSFRQGDLTGQFPSWRSGPAITAMCRWTDFICLAVQDAGVFLFPVRATAGDSKLGGVRVLGQDEGLLHPYVVGLAGVGEDLFIAHERALLAWRPGQRGMTLVASLEAQMGDHPLAGLGPFVGILAGPQGNRLYAVIEQRTRTGGSGFKIALTAWRYAASTRQWTRVAERTDLGGGLLANTADGRHIILTGMAAGQPTQLPRFLGFFGSFDGVTERLTRPKEEGFPQLPVAEALAPHFDVVEYERGAITIDVGDDGWAVRYLVPRSAGEPTALAWAPHETTEHPAAQPQPRIAAGVKAAEPPTPAAGVVLPLAGAAAAGDTDRVKALLATGADINGQDEKGRTALAHALASNRTETALLLIRAGADLRHLTQRGCSPLAFAAERNMVEVVKELLARKVPVDEARGACPTPLLVAVGAGATEAAALLIEHGADVNRTHPSEPGNTVLMVAILRGLVPVAKQLVDRGAKLEGTDRNGNTALMAAAVAGQVDILQYLLERGAKIDVANHSGASALLQAIWKEQSRTACALVAAGADLTHRSEDGRTLLMQAAWRPLPDVVKCLIDKDADVNAATPTGWTALIHAAHHGHADNIRILLDAGADIDAEARTEINGKVVRRYKAIDTAMKPEAWAVLEEEMGRRLKKTP
ncbi:ankyrin repeat domain-containing protein [bacterium]|nr:ankyrin repeat domain-containing protein [bacterium]